MMLAVSDYDGRLRAPVIDVGTKQEVTTGVFNSTFSFTSGVHFVDFAVADRLRKLKSLEAVITKSVGVSSIFSPNSIDSETAAYGKLLLALLGAHRPLPKVGVDGEGGLMFVWEYRRTVLATLFKDSLFITVDPGTLNSSNWDDKKLTGRNLPPELEGSLEGV